MPTRRAIILKWANDESHLLIDSIPDNLPTRKSNYEKIYRICKYLVEKAKPLMPSASEVSQSARAKPFGYEPFLAPQTIYNDYGKMLGIWRKALRDLGAVESEPSITTGDLLGWDVAHLDAGSQYNVRRLQRLCRELVQKNNALKQLITDHVPVQLDTLGKADDRIVNELSDWLMTVTLNGFAKNEFGLVVTRHTPPHTIIMDAVLFDHLQRLVSAAETAEPTKRNFRGNAKSTEWPAAG